MEPKNVLYIQPRPVGLRRRMPLYAGIGVLLASGVVAGGAVLMRRHAALYGVSPDLTISARPLTSVWAAPLAGFALGLLLLGAGLGGAAYLLRARRSGSYWPLWQEDGFWRFTLLLALGVALLWANLPAALDATLAAPVRETGTVSTGGANSGLAGTSYYIALDGRELTTSHATMLAAQDECVAIVYAPHAAIAFSVRVIIPGRVPPPGCSYGPG